MFDYYLFYELCLSDNDGVVYYDDDFVGDAPERYYPEDIQEEYDENPQEYVDTEQNLPIDYSSGEETSEPEERLPIEETEATEEEIPEETDNDFDVNEAASAFAEEDQESEAPKTSETDNDDNDNVVEDGDES